MELVAGGCVFEVVAVLGCMESEEELEIRAKASLPGRRYGPRLQQEGRGWVERRLG